MLPPDLRDAGREFLKRLSREPVFEQYGNRDLLLSGLPKQGITRHHGPAADLNSILSAVASYGQLEDGRIALAILAENALLLLSGTETGAWLTSWLTDLEIRPFQSSTVPEAIIGEDNRLPISFLKKGLECAASVCKVKVPTYRSGNRQMAFSSGTGWMLSASHMLTCLHVIEARDPHEPAASAADLVCQIASLEAEFGYDCKDDTGKIAVPVGNRPLISSDRTLDYALVELNMPTETLSEPLKALKTSRSASFKRYETRLNIIQHSRGEAKQIAIRGNRFVELSGNHIEYVTDTEPGSSGAPVFDDDWTVVGMHGASVRKPVKGTTISRILNQAVNINAILSHLAAAGYQY